MKLIWPVPAAPGQEGGKELPSPWWIAVNFAQAYSEGIHTGIDLNLNGYADSGKPIVCAADGIVRFSGDGAAIGWTQARKVVVVEHAALGLWTRYAHLRVDPALARVGAPIRAGELIGNIGDYGKPGPPDDHLHFDVAVRNLTTNPGDWPGHAVDALTRVLLGYINPIMLFRACNAQ